MRGGWPSADARRAPAPPAVCRQSTAARSRGGKEPAAATHVSRAAAGGGARPATDRRREAPRCGGGSLLAAVGRGAAALGQPPRSGGGAPAVRFCMLQLLGCTVLGLQVLSYPQCDSNAIPMRFQCDSIVSSVEVYMQFIISP